MMAEASGADSYCDEGARAGARVMREIIRTPAFLEIIKTNMTALDPEGARIAVRTILWEDPELALSLASTVPEVVNYLVEAVLELGRQLNQFPEPLLNAFIDQLVLGVDPEELRQFPAVYGPLMQKIGFQQRATKVFGAAVNAVARAINTTAEKNPYFVRDAVENVDGTEVARAAWAVTRSLLLWGCSAVVRIYKRFAGAGVGA